VLGGTQGNFGGRQELLGSHAADEFGQAE